MLSVKKEKLLIVDFGSQYTHLIARRVRELGVYSEIIPYSSWTSTEDVKGVILSGGPMSVWSNDSPKVSLEIIRQTMKRKIPVLGICYGFQLIAWLFGGEVIASPSGEYGPTTLHITNESSLFRGLPRKIRVWMSHRDIVKNLPKKFTSIARTNKCPIAAFESVDGIIFGVQFHPEVYHTEYGIKILENFLEICGFSRIWRVESCLLYTSPSPRDRG